MLSVVVGFLSAEADPTPEGIGGAPNDCAKDAQGAREAVGHLF